jgi:hypothetical protein
MTAEKRNDNVLQCLKKPITDSSAKGEPTEPRSGPPEDIIVYHRSCYAKYTSKTNLIHHEEETSPCQETSPSRSCSSSRLARTATPCFNKTVCIVCLKKTYKKDPKLYNVATKDREHNLRLAAKARNDMAMLLRVGPEDGPDLVALDAVYHKACMSSYTSKTNLAVQTLKHEREGQYEDGEGKDYDHAFRQLIDEIHDDLVKHGKAFQLSTLLEWYIEHLPDSVNKYTYRAEKLERRLVKYYGDQITIQKRYGQGRSSLIFSSSVTLSDALKATSDLKQRLKDVQCENFESLMDDDVEDEPNVYTSLHKAVGLLRQAILAIEHTNEYPASNEVSIEASEAFVPKHLAVAMKWLIDKNAFDSADPEYVSSNDTKRKYLTMAECAIFCSQNRIITPFHFGLAVQMHNDYAKRAIIDTLHSYGLCIAYDELRTFMTSAATEEMTKNPEGYIPSEIIPITLGGALIHEGDDNIDINAETIDGKHTFHSMARVIFQEQSANTPVTNITRVKHGHKKSLVLTEEVNSLMECTPFQKPAQRPEPPKVEMPLEKLKACKIVVCIFIFSYLSVI